MTPPDEAAVRASARAAGLPVAPVDLPAVTAHLALLLRYAEEIGDPEPEPAPVFRP